MKLRDRIYYLLLAFSLITAGVIGYFISEFMRDSSVVPAPVIISSPDMLRYFESTDELRDFLSKWEYHPTETGIEKENDCDDQVEQFIDDATSAGFRVAAGASLQLPKGHYVACTIIDNQFYFIELENRQITDTLYGVRWLRDY